MKPNFFMFLAIGFLGVVLSCSVLAQQNRENIPASNLYVISVKAGAVNFVMGEVFNQGKDGKQVLLNKSDIVAAGDVVTTAEIGRAEILLSPGSYVRLAANSEFQFVNTSLDEDLELKLNKGSAIFEVVADKEYRFVINTPKARFYLVQSGIYRVDVLDAGAGKISVWKGKALVGDAKSTTVKGGKSAIFENMQTTVAKFDRDDKGEFEVWSKQRAESIAQVNKRLVERQMRQSLMTSFNNNSWSAANGFGLWVQDPFTRTFCFLPFGWGWRSPYGFGFNQSIWNYNPPPQVVAPIYRNPNVSNPTVGNPVVITPPNVSTSNPGSGGGNFPSVSPPSRRNPDVETGSPSVGFPRTQKSEISRPIDN